MGGYREVNQEYFDWMCSKISNETYDSTPFLGLLHCLHTIIFDWTIPMDSNRASDGENLRYRFSEEMHVPQPLVAATIDNDDCTVLEMLVALSIRCEEDIMGDPEEGDRTPVWFWSMIENLGLLTMTNVRFDEHYIREVIDRFLNHEYSYDGKGGLFYVENPRKDLRQTEIWYQMCYHLNSMI